MEEERKNYAGLIVIFALIIAVGTTAFFIFTDVEFSIFGNGKESKVDSGVKTESTRLSLCSNYLTKEECEADIDLAANSNHPGWFKLKCEDEKVNCLCLWSYSKSECELFNLIVDDDEESGIVETNITENVSDGNYLIDLESVNLTLKNVGCNNETNNTELTCNMSISGTVKNSGSAAIPKAFAIYFIDGSERFDIINIFNVAEDFASGEEKVMSFYYEELLPGDYWIKIFADSKKEVEETNEENNEIIEMIKMNKNTVYEEVSE